MDTKLNERENLLNDYLVNQKKLTELEHEIQRLRESNFHLVKELEEKESAVQNLFSYIEVLQAPQK